MPEITKTTIGEAWQSAVLLANASPRKEVSNLIVNVTRGEAGFALGSQTLQRHLDDSLAAQGKFQTRTVSNTIFPQSLLRKGLDRDALFNRYLSLWPRIVTHRQNRRGTYFQRLIGYPLPGLPYFNQLEFVISAYKGGTRRRSALQCGILAPAIDLNATPYQGFPCMQQLAFLPEGKNGLRISAFYPMQYLFARAYGNYWGLINLGSFMAKEMGLELIGMTCVALVAKLDHSAAALGVLESSDAI